MQSVLRSSVCCTYHVFLKFIAWHLIFIFLAFWWYCICCRNVINDQTTIWRRTWFEIIVNNRWLDFVEVLESGNCLNDDGPCLLLRQKLVLLQIEVEVVTLTVAKHCTEPDTHDINIINRCSSTTHWPVDFSWLLPNPWSPNLHCLYLFIINLQCSTVKTPKKLK